MVDQQFGVDAEFLEQCRGVFNGETGYITHGMQTITVQSFVDAVADAPEIS